MRVKVEDTCQLTSCFNESEGKRYRSKEADLITRFKSMSFCLFRLSMCIRCKLCCGLKVFVFVNRQSATFIYHCPNFLDQH